MWITLGVPVGVFLLKKAITHGKKKKEEKKLQELESKIKLLQEQLNHTQTD